MTIRAQDDADYIIVGGGIAGLRAALTLAAVGRVVMLTKADAGETNTGWAQGGIAAAMASDDSPSLHLSDTLRAGDGLCDEAAVRVLVEEGPRYVRELIAWGTRFDAAPSGELIFGLEAAHSVRRILHAGDATGREISRALWQRVAAFPRIRVVHHARVASLTLDADGIRGVRYFDAAGVPQSLAAPRVLLATGGAGQVFRETTNPAVATGDGIALAYRAGARVADLEFVQFHPTALSVPGAPRFLISEALRGEGARLVNVRGEGFMTRYHPDGDLAPRDVVARGIAREIEATGGPVSLTLAHLDAAHVRGRFPTIAAMCLQLGLDIARDRIPVGPAAHYLMGGIDTDTWGRTSVPGLYAAGETACTGVHGANRLASNSLLEGLVFGARAAEAMQAAACAAPVRSGVRVVPPASDSGTGDDRRGAVAPVGMTRADIQDVMWRAAGVFRTRDDLRRAVVQLESAMNHAAQRLESRDGPEAEAWQHHHFTTVAALVARAALRRDESRGGHYRADFPTRDDLHWAVHLAEQVPAPRA